MQPETIRKAAAVVLQTIRRRNEHGRPVHNDDAIRHLVPWLAIKMRVDFETLPPKIQAIVVAFIDQLGLTEEADYDALLAATEAHYRRAPIEPTLWREVNLAIRRALALLSDSQRGRLARRHGPAIHGTGVFRTALSNAAPIQIPRTVGEETSR